MGEYLSNLLNFDVSGPILGKILSAIVLLIICLIVVKILMSALKRVLQHSKIDAGLHGFLKTVVRVFLLFLTVLIVASSLGIPVTSLIAVLSVAGLALSLAIQNSLSNVAGGIQLLTSRPFKVGDFVEAGGVSGTVREIGLFYTRVLTLDNKLIQIPNSEIAGEKVINYTAEPLRRVDMVFSASYNAPVATVEQVLMGVIKSHPLTLDDPASFARVTKYGESAIEYTIKTWCETKHYWEVYYDMPGLVKAAFDAAGIEMTYPHINVHMIGNKEAK